MDFLLLLFVVPADAVVDPVVVGGLLIELLDVVGVPRAPWVVSP